MTGPITDGSTEAGVVAELAASALDPTYIEVGGARVLYGAYPESWRLHQLDLEAYEAKPRRARGTVMLNDVASFLAYIDQQTGGWDEQGDTASQWLPSIYLDPAQLRARAIFNDHTTAGPGWRDHIAKLWLLTSPEWRAWAAIDRQFLPAEAFAEHIEEWKHTIADPPTADLLDLVRSFRAVKKATYGREIVDRTGAVALEWSEEVNASGSKGQLEIPDGFGLVMSPFDGAPPVAVPARFRYRVGDGRATFGVVLEQAAKILRDAFDAEVERIRDHAPFVVMVGDPQTGA